MGGSFSSTDYRESIIKFQKDFLSQDDNEALTTFLVNSEDFYNVFTSCTLDDYRKVKEEKPDNIIYSHLSRTYKYLLYTNYRASKWCMI